MSSTQELKNLQDVNLLLVEDNSEAREFTKNILSNFFRNIILAKDGQDALEKFKDNDIGFIVTDIDMPNLDGIAMLEEIKKIKPKIYTVVISAITDINSIKRLIDIGIDCFINKPIKDISVLTDFLEKVSQNIENKALKKELEMSQVESEKLRLILKMIQSISHHWRQPLSVISTIASGICLKNDLEHQFTIEDFKNLDSINEKVMELAEVLSRIENINYNEITLGELEELISISNPSYKKENDV